MREKLIELIAQKVCDTWSESCDEWLPHDCGKCYANDCHIADIADHLIANGVTLDKKVASSSKCIASNWIPVTERLPEDGQWVLTYYADKKHRVTKYDSYDGFPLVFTTGLEWVRVTHWMPLPEAPKGE